MSIHTAILCPMCKDIIGTRTSTLEGKIRVSKDENHQCGKEPNLWTEFKPLGAK